MANGSQQIVLFYVLIAFFALIGVASLAVLLGFVKTADRGFRKWAVPGFAGAVVAAVIGVYKASNVPAFVPIVVTLLPPAGAQPPPLKSGTFQYDEVTADNKVLTHSGSVVPVLGEGNWQVQLPGEVSNKAIQLSLEDEDGKSWRTGRFFANYVRQELRAGAKPPVVGDATWQMPGVAIVSAAAAEPLTGGQQQAGIKFNNYARQTGSQMKRPYYEWRVFVDEPAAVLDTIVQVDYVLHPTFPEPFQSSRDRGNQFELKASGWGGFPIVITVHYTNGKEAKASYMLDLSKSWPAQTARAAAPATLRLTLDKITVKEDGSSGATGWTFDVLLDGQRILNLPNKNYSDRPARGAGASDYAPGLAPVTLASDKLARGQAARLEVRGTRSFGGDTAIGGADLSAAAAGALLVTVANRDPRKGAFVFSFSLAPGR